jgi:hypothetical protein
MLLMLTAKRYELATGKLLFGSRRSRINRFGARAIFILGTALPHFVRYEVLRAYRGLWSLVHRVLFHTAKRSEHFFDKVLRNVQEKTGERAEGEASPFLREVGEYKKQLSDSGVRRIDQE